MKKNVLLIAVLLFLPLAASSQEVFMTRRHKLPQAPQGMALHGRFLFDFRNTGTCYVYDFARHSGDTLGSFSLASAGKMQHANCANFGVEKAPGASFPLVYITNGKPGSPLEWKCSVESITRKGGKFTCEQVQTITLDPSNWAEAGYEPVWGCPAWLPDAKRGCLWVFSAQRRTTIAATGDFSNNRYIATQFRLPRLSEGAEVVLGAADIISQTVFPFDVYATQGGCAHDGKIWFSFGFKLPKHVQDPPQMRLYDCDSGQVRTLDIGSVAEEPEDIFLKGRWLYLNTNSLKVYRFKK